MTLHSPLVSVIIPAYNEQRHLGECVRSLHAQTYHPLEIIVVDDGSRDHTGVVALQSGVRLLRQEHMGKARAIAHGAAAARGQILVFLDADLLFAPDFLEHLIRPIISGDCLGTSHADELVANPENVWARCLQLASGMPPEERLRLSPQQRKEGTVVYRAVLADAFRRVGGFDDVGYTDDQTLAQKLGEKARFVDGAVCRHYNPASLAEVFAMGVWKGKSVWHRRRWRGIRDYFPLRSMLRGATMAIRQRFLPLAVFVPVVELGILWGVTKRVLGIDRTYGA